MLRLFISYSHMDREWCDRLYKHLVGIDKEVLAEIWYDTRISPGSQWDNDIFQHLNNADVVVFLVSANFVDSDFCALEIDEALKRQESGKCIVIPVLLRHYNLAGSGYAHLQFSPQGGPIDSDSWSDKDLAFATVSKEIEKAARLQLGNTSRRTLAPSARVEFQKLLHHLCDRLPQKDALRRALAPEKLKEHRPFVIVVFGQQQDSLEWFLSRLEHVLLKKYFSQLIGRLSPLEWPEYARGLAPTELFGSSLTDCLNARPFASIAEMNAALAALSPVSILPSSVPAGTWDKKTEALFDAYLQLWQEWPKLPADRVLIPVVTIEYPEDMPAEHRLRRYLKRLNFESMPGVGGVVLPAMTPIELMDFQNWLRLEQVRPRIAEPEKAIDKSNQITQEFPSRMYHLAEKHLPRLLQQL